MGSRPVDQYYFHGLAIRAACLAVGHPNRPPSSATELDPRFPRPIRALGAINERNPSSTIRLDADALWLKEQVVRGVVVKA
jgi:hypothetical protein